MKRCLNLLFGALCAAVLVTPVMSVAQSNAKPPTQMTYQGFLTDANGVPFGNTTPVNKTVIFRIYDALTGGTLKWSSQQVVTVDKGYFSVLLGQGSSVGSEPFSADLTSTFTGAGASDRYLDLTADGTTIAPRLRFLPAPSALLAKSATELLDPNSGAVMLSGSGGNLTVAGNIAASNVSGNGANLTGLNASQITSGTLANARTTATAAGSANTIVLRDNAGVGYFSNNSTGGAGIGATAQGSEVKLDGFGYHNFSFLNTSGDLQMGISDTGGILGTPVTPYLTLRGNGNVGIGTSVPETRLHLDESTGTMGANGTGTITLDHENDGGASSIVFRSRINRGGADFGYIQYQDNSASSASGGENAILTIGIMNDADDHIALMPSGNVGVGTTAPTSKLHVAGQVTADSFRIANTTTYVLFSLTRFSLLATSPMTGVTQTLPANPAISTRQSSIPSDWWKSTSSYGATAYTGTFSVPAGEMWEVIYSSRYHWSTDDSGSIVMSVDDVATDDASTGFWSVVTGPHALDQTHFLSSGSHVVRVKAVITGGSGSDAIYYPWHTPSHCVVRKYKVN